jgi:hypothetical protein
MPADVLVIDGALRREVREAIVEAFGSLVEFRIVVSEALNRELPQIIAEVEQADVGTAEVSVAAFHVIRWAAMKGRLPDLVAAAAREKPGSQPLQDLAARIAGRPEQVVLKEVPFQSGDELEAKMRCVRRAVCRIEPQPEAHPLGTDGYGTGFLVAPDVVMTNHHVVKDFPRVPDRGPDRVAFRFDYERRAGGPRQPAGRACRLADDWLVFHSVAAKLDFALVRLAERPGEDKVGGGRKRGYLLPVDHDFKENETLIIFQHPQAGCLVSSPGPVLKPRDGDWVTYHVNTKDGSSGSPCLTYDMKLVAIHHWGARHYNRGVRFGPILQHLKANKGKLRKKGLTGVLGLGG